MLTSAKKLLKLSVILLVIFCGFKLISLHQNSSGFGAPPYIEEAESDIDSSSNYSFIDEYANWKRPEGPIRIGLQAGHWKTAEMPEEQYKIRESGGGTSGKGVAEWEVVLKIAQLTSEILEKEGYVVDILPATVPEDYLADAFVSIHADGNLNPMVNGYKVAPSARDRTGNADELSNFISEEYGKETGLPVDPNISRNMTRYYAFNTRRYVHAIHSMTPGVLVETGFMTNYKEASLLIDKPEIPARGIANGIIRFVNNNVK